MLGETNGRAELPFHLVGIGKAKITHPIFRQILKIFAGAFVLCEALSCCRFSRRYCRLAVLFVLFVVWAFALLLAAIIKVETGDFLLLLRELFFRPS